jgi:hypothetical protein
MIENKLNTAFPFYRSLDRQNYRKDWAYDDVCTFQLISPFNRLLPFQVRRTNNPALITTCELWCYDDTYQMDLLPYITFDYATIEGYDYITYNGDELLDGGDAVLDGVCGDFYIKLGDGTNIWYSEVIHLINEVSGGTSSDDLHWSADEPIIVEPDVPIII